VLIELVKKNRVYTRICYRYIAFYRKL